MCLICEAQNLGNCMTCSLNARDQRRSVFRCAVLATLVNVVRGLGEQSMKLHPLLLNIIHASSDPNSPALVYLLPDCLDLWISVMHNTTRLTPELLQLFPNLLGL